jgi:hypothetical protein
MDIQPAALVTILDEMHQRVHLNETTRHWFWDVYEVVPPNPYWAESAAAAVVNQHLTQTRLAEVIGGDGTTGRAATANAQLLDQFTERCLATPFDGIRNLLGGIVVVVHVPVLPPPRPIPPNWDGERYPDGVPGIDLLQAGAQFYKAAQQPDAKSESAIFTDTALKLLHEGLIRISAKSE